MSSRFEHGVFPKSICLPSSNSKPGKPHRLLASHSVADCVCERPKGILVRRLHHQGLPSAARTSCVLEYIPWLPRSARNEQTPSPSGRTASSNARQENRGSLVKRRHFGLPKEPVRYPSQCSYGAWFVRKLVEKSTFVDRAEFHSTDCLSKIDVEKVCENMASRNNR